MFVTRELTCVVPPDSLRRLWKELLRQFIWYKHQGWHFQRFLMEGLNLLVCMVASFGALVFSGVEGIGINYGLLGNNLPPPTKVIPFLKSKNISKVRLFEPNHQVLKALSNSGISVTFGPSNPELRQLSSNPHYAKDWVQQNILPFASSVKFDYMLAGNEVIPGPSASYVLGAMQNLDAALKAVHLKVPVSTSVSTVLLRTPYPPSAAQFSNASTLIPIVQFLASNGYPFMVAVYPYYAYIHDTVDISRDYALFLSKKPVFMDGKNPYSNLFDAILDACYSSLEKLGGSFVKIVVSETGWPSAGHEFASIENAEAYNVNLVKHVGLNQGTPKRPGKAVETYIFALFNENLKPEGAERNWGLYYPNMTEVYHVL